MSTMNSKNEPRMEYDTMPLGDDERCNISLDTGKTSLNNNMIIMGGTGSGKSLSVAVPMMLHARNTNIVAICTKRSTIDLVRNSMRRRGYSTALVDFTDPSRSEYGYDPLLHCKTDSDIDDLAYAVVNSSDDSPRIKNDPYWDDQAQALISVILRHVRHGHYDGGNDISSAVYLLENITDDASAVDDMTGCDPQEVKKVGTDDYEKLMSCKKENPTHAALWNLKRINERDYRIWYQYNNNAPNTCACITSSVMQHVAKVFTADIRRFLGIKKQYSFKELLKPRTALFVLVSPVNAAQHAFIGTFYHQLFKELFEMGEAHEKGRLPYPVQVICDDFATGCHVPDFEQTISIFREKGIAATMLIQNESQLGDIYTEAKARTIISNCDTIVYLGGMDLKTNKDIAERADLPLSDVQYMPVGKEIFLRRGEKPIFTRRYDTMNDPLYIMAAGREI